MVEPSTEAWTEVGMLLPDHFWAPGPADRKDAA